MPDVPTNDEETTMATKKQADPGPSVKDPELYE